MLLKLGQIGQGADHMRVVRGGMIGEQGWELGENCRKVVLQKNQQSDGG